MSRKLPLDAVRVVRAQQLDAAAAAREVAAAATARAEAELAVRRGAEARSRDEAARTDAEALSAFVEEGGCAADLAQHAAWRGAAAQRIEAAAAASTRAAGALEAAARLEEQQREALLAARAELDAVDRFRARVAAQREADGQAKLDEAAEEAHAARARR
jgi:hypothetical protein